MKHALDIAVLGATGMVGETVLSILAQRKFPVKNLYALGSERSAGSLCTFDKKSVPVLSADAFDFSNVQLCFSAVDNDVIKKLQPRITAAGCFIIDKSSLFRDAPDVPLIVPEVNPEAVSDSQKRSIISTPNCSTIPLAVVLKPLYDAVGIERMNIATYQSVSGAGKHGVEELSQQTMDLFHHQAIKIKHFPVQIAFNVIPHIDQFLENGYTREEMKVVWELQKIFKDTSLKINPTAVRVPVFYGHCAALHLETRDAISADHAKILLKKSPGIILMDEPKNAGYPTPVMLSEKEDAVYAGRIRQDLSHPRGLNLWVVADNVRKGAALNAVQIAELLLQEKYL